MTNRIFEIHVMCRHEMIYCGKNTIELKHQYRKQRGFIVCTYTFDDCHTFVEWEKNRVILLWGATLSLRFMID